MSGNDPTIPSALEGWIISANLNSTMLLNLLTGIYTMIYGGTVYLYLSKKTSAKSPRTVLWAISALYLLFLLSFAVQWYLINSAFVINGETRDSIFNATLDTNPQWAWQLCVVLLNVMLIISDGLLVWRCYHVWGQSLWVFLIPSVLLLAEFSLMVTSAVLNAKFGQLASDAEAAFLNNITSAFDFVSLGTTVTATCLIWYRIHSTLRLKGSPSRGPFMRILILIIESAAVYTVVLFFDAVTFALPVFSQAGTPLVQVNYYSTVILNVVAGMAPTVMVARLALTSQSQNPPSPPITRVSGLNFHHEENNSGSSHTTGAAFASSGGPIDVGLSPAGQMNGEEKEIWGAQAC